MWQSASNAVVRLLFGPECPACRRALDHPLSHAVCPACWLTIPQLTPPWCDWCGDALPSAGQPYDLCARCLTAPPSFDAARSAGVYDGTLRTLILAFKYQRQRQLAAPLASLMVAAAGRLLAGADAVVPVPLHPLRTLHRGFNQADDLARHLGLPVWRLLRRVRHDPPQASLPASRRTRNVSGAFSERPRFRLTLGAPSPPRVRHATVVLIDDVMTTGATLDACSRVLVDAGARSVRAVTVARAATPRPAPPRPRPHPSSAPRR